MQMEFFKENLLISGCKSANELVHCFVGIKYIGLKFLGTINRKMLFQYLELIFL